MKKASIGVRFGALLLDNIFINLIIVFVCVVSPYLIFVTPFITFLYYGICEGSSMSATFGKKMCGLIVVDEYGNKLTSAQGFTRSICRIISAAILGIGFLIALFDEENKALHDKMARTFVAKMESNVIPSYIPTVATLEKPVVVSASSQHKPTIICISGQFAGRAININQQGIVFGRDHNLCDFAFPETTQGISRIHCKVLFNPQTQMFILYDMGSSYGTFLENGNRILQDQPIALRSGEGFYLASNLNFFRVNL